MTTPEIGDNSDHRRKFFDRFAQLYRERQQNDEDLAELSDECKAFKIEDVADIRAVARESVAPLGKRTKKDLKEQRLARVREEFGV